MPEPAPFVGAFPQTANSPYAQKRTTFPLIRTLLRWLMYRKLRKCKLAIGLS